MGNFNLKDLKTLVEDFDRIEKFYVDAENDKYITYYPSFSDDKIGELIKDLFETVKVCESKGVKDFDDNQYVNEYLSFLTIKHFTSLKNELKGKAYSTHKKAMTELTKVGLIRTFLDHIFEYEQVRKVFDRFNELYNVGLEQITRMEEEFEGMKNLKVLSN